MKNNNLAVVYNALSSLDKKEATAFDMKLIRKTRAIVKEALDEFTEVRKDIFKKKDIEDDEQLEELKKASPEEHRELIEEVNKYDETEANLDFSGINTRKLTLDKLLTMSKNYNEVIVDLLEEVLVSKESEVESELKSV